jgi:hypothetical protein
LASNSKAPAKVHVIGICKSNDGAIFEFNGDGTFTEKSFPEELVLLPIQEFKDVKFDGSGDWLLRKNESD